MTKNEEKDAEKEANKVVLQETKDLLEQINRANENTRELLQQQAEIKETEIISGKSEAGEVPIEIDKEQEIKDRCNIMLEGIGMKI